MPAPVAGFFISGSAFPSLKIGPMESGNRPDYAKGAACCQQRRGNDYAFTAVLWMHTNETSLQTASVRCLPEPHRPVIMVQGHCANRHRLSGHSVACKRL